LSLLGPNICLLIIFSPIEGFSWNLASTLCRQSPPKLGIFKTKFLPLKGKMRSSTTFESIDRFSWNLVRSLQSHAFNFVYCEMRIWRSREIPRKAGRRVTYPMWGSWNEYVSLFEVISLYSYNVMQSCGGCTKVVLFCFLAGGIWRCVVIGLNPVRHVLSVVCFQTFVTGAQNV
jgi:hypothetical protein